MRQALEEVRLQRAMKALEARAQVGGGVLACWKSTVACVDMLAVCTFTGDMGMGKGGGDVLTRVGGSDHACI